MSEAQEIRERVGGLEAKHANIKHQVCHETREAVRKEYERLVLGLAQGAPSARRLPDTPSDFSLVSDVGSLRDRLNDLKGFRAARQAPVNAEGPLVAHPESESICDFSRIELASPVPAPQS